MRPLLVAGVLLFASACGSTVQVSSSLAGDPALVGSAPNDAGGQVSLPSSAEQPATGRSTGPVAPQPAASAGVGAGTRQGTGARVAQASGIPGVTSTTITVGVLAADPSADQTLEGAGFGAASLGNEPASWRAMADEVNARGGIAGRRLSLVFHLVNLTEPPASQGQAACERFTQDHKVALVLSGYYYASAHTCLAQKGVPALLGTNYGVDARGARDSSTVVAWATPLLDRFGLALPDAFQRMGKLKPGTSAGIFVTDAPAFTRSASVLSAALTRRGVKVMTQTVRDSDSGDYGAATSDASAAVLRFRSADVTEVMFLTHNAFEPTLLMQAASSQGYRPTYLLSTQQYPATLVGLAPAGQLDGAVAVGWAPAIDLSSGYASSAPARECLSQLNKRGRTFSSGSQTLVGLLACDGVELLRRAAAVPDALATRASLRGAALSSSTAFVSAVTFTTRFAGGRPDGVDGYRPMAFADGRFSYTGPVTQL